MELGGTTLNLSDPVTLAALAGAGLLLLIVILLIMAVRAAGRSARMAAPLAQQMRVLGGHVQQLGQGQEQLRGGLQMVSDTQSNTQAQMMQSMEARLAYVQQQMQDQLVHVSTEKHDFEELASGTRGPSDNHRPAHSHPAR